MPGYLFGSGVIGPATDDILAAGEIDLKSQERSLLFAQM
jgi:hypothetical protein